MALFFNVKINLEEPFVNMENPILAQTMEGGDCEPGGYADVCCPYWNITYPSQGPSSCTTGGEFICNSCPPKSSID
ncbi:hypothetical protein SAMN04488104_1001156 [Algoriphagus faecimaris]|uniref:Uncharacterized protein n=1 Tax=Algoriphagus faecimaris TaxID=686796 RepID=A0A1G6MEY8_9BACT|nr:hypothetical protein SAMN04488104_1001156 [Algoriphagus faecimaris]